MKTKHTLMRTSTGACAGILAAIGLLALAGTVPAAGTKPSREFNERGNILIADQYNNRVIRVNHAGQIVASYGLPLAGGPVTPFQFGNNVGCDLRTTQKGLYSPYDAKVIGDYTGLTPPLDFDGDHDD